MSQNLEFDLEYQIGKGILEGKPTKEILESFSGVNFVLNMAVMNIRGVDDQHYEVVSADGVRIKQQFVGMEAQLMRALAAEQVQIFILERHPAIVELETVHQVLDEAGIPRQVEGKDMLLWGRIQKYATPLILNITPDEMLKIPVDGQNDVEDLLGIAEMESQLSMPDDKLSNYENYLKIAEGFIAAIREQLVKKSKPMTAEEFGNIEIPTDEEGVTMDFDDITAANAFNHSLPYPEINERMLTALRNKGVII